jgi:hypothetical protein
MVQCDNMGRVAIWPAFGLATGLILGLCLFDVPPAHSSEFNRKDPIVQDDARQPRDVIHMTVGDILTEYDQALNRYGPDQGIKFKQMLNAYLLGIETGLYVENSVRVREQGETGFLCLTSLMTGAQLVDFLKDRVRESPKFADGWYQISLARALTAAFACPGS